jgi:RNA polymerase sigma-70 factor (ECF subfamily)
VTPDSIGTRHIDPGEPVREGAEARTEATGEKGDGLRRITEEDFFRVQPKLVARFRWLGASREEARDLTQETFLRAQRGLDTFEGRSQLDTWLVSIAKRVWLQNRRDHRRQKRSAVEVSLEILQGTADVPSAALDLEGDVIARDRLVRAKQAIKELPEAMRQALTLHLEGHKYHRIAALLRVSENQVSSLIHQARQKLRRVVSEQPAD